MLGNRVNDLEDAAGDPGQAAGRARLREQPVAPASTKPPNAPPRNCATRSPPCRRRQIAGDRKAAQPRRPRSRTPLGVARDERAKLQRDINAIQQQAESSWATERMENALLRERINDIAAEVAKLAMQLEGPNSPIEAMLAAEPATPQAGEAAPMAPPTALPPAAYPRAAARSPNASARCSPTPPAPASRAPEPLSLGRPARLARDRLTLAPALRKSRL